MSVTSTELGGHSSVFSLSIQQSRRLPGNMANMSPSYSVDQVFKIIKKHHRDTEEMPRPVECLLYSHETPSQISRIYKYTNRERGVVCASWESQCWGDGDRQATLDSLLIWIPGKWKTLSLKKGMNFKDVGFLRNYRQGCPLALPQTCVHVHLHTYEHIQTHMAGGRENASHEPWLERYVWRQPEYVASAKMSFIIYLFIHSFIPFFLLFILFIIPVGICMMWAGGARVHILHMETRR